MPKPVVSHQTARILAMLLQCGMICKEELQIVLDMIDVSRTRRDGCPVAGDRG